MRRPLRLAAALLAMTVLAGCTTDQNGHLWTVINDSARDVVIDVASATQTRILVPANVHTWLSVGWEQPRSGWGVTVMDAHCGVLATIPILIGRANVYVAADGTIDLSHGDGDAFNTGPGRRIDTSDLPRAPSCVPTPGSRTG